MKLMNSLLHQRLAFRIFINDPKIKLRANKHSGPNIEIEFYWIQINILTR